MADEHVMLVFTNPLPGQEKEYNEWYDTVHLREVKELPGVVAAERLEYAGELAGFGGSEHSYAAIYRIEGSPAETASALKDAIESGRMALSPALDVEASQIWIYSVR
jgi:hypothetical protein